MGKAFAVFVLVVVVGLVVAFFAGGLGSFDPAADAEKFKAAVKPGMSWQQVLALAKPGKWMQPNIEAASGTTPPQKFDEAKFEQRAKERPFVDGFIWQYAFTSEHTYLVIFSPEGKVLSLHRPMSMGDLLQGKLPQ